jgi:Xaa-Pro aminopeptidase
VNVTRAAACGPVLCLDSRKDAAVSARTRLASLRARLAAEKVDAIALTEVANVAYVTGLLGVFDEEPAHVALVSADAAVLYTDSRYLQALTDASAGSDWQVRMATVALHESVCADLAEMGAGSLALETSLPHVRFRAFADEFDGEVREATGWVETLRAVKDAEEIARIDAAQALTDRAFEHILSKLRVGAVERDIALELEFFMRREGSEGVAFAPIVASGPNAALPHAIPGGRALEAGDFVILDFGARVDDYCADMTRTVVIGKASERHREVYDTVLAANEAGAGAVAAGVNGRDVDAAARAIIVERGFGDRFGHGLGHGVGREVHERPGVGPRSDEPLCVGNVITIEPGIYIPGFGGVRIEDLAVVQETGARILTRSAKQLLEL